MSSNIDNQAQDSIVVPMDETNNDNPSSPVFSSGGPAMGDSVPESVSNHDMVPEVSVPIPAMFLDADGNPFTQDTPFAQFPDWPTYTLFCSQGPVLSLRCVEYKDDGSRQGYVEIRVSKKMLVDFGDYFAAAVRHGWQEAKEGIITFEDIDAKDMLRLILLVSAGAPAARINIGRCYETLSNLLSAYVLADRFQMPLVKAWIQATVDDYLKDNRSWNDVYLHQVHGQPSVPGVQNIHKGKVMDFNNAWVQSSELPETICPFPKETYVHFMIEYCPRVLLNQMWDRLHVEFAHEVGRMLL